MAILRREMRRRSIIVALSVGWMVLSELVLAAIAAAGDAGPGSAARDQEHEVRANWGMDPHVYDSLVHSMLGLRIGRSPD